MNIYAASVVQFEPNEELPSLFFTQSSFIDEVFVVSNLFIFMIPQIDKMIEGDFPFYLKITEPICFLEIFNIFSSHVWKVKRYEKDLIIPVFVYIAYFTDLLNMLPLSFLFLCQIFSPIVVCLEILEPDDSKSYNKSQDR